ncbi:MAG: hypothetical protein QOG31_1311 [Thermoplasmata archaeon]|jgi:hypothetical protein|nr:hypothetical protein [Thermoplasmata archaeon]
MNNQPNRVGAILALLLCLASLGQLPASATPSDPCAGVPTANLPDAGPCGIAGFHWTAPLPKARQIVDQLRKGVDLAGPVAVVEDCRDTIHHDGTFDLDTFPLSSVTGCLPTIDYCHNSKLHLPPATCEPTPATPQCSQVTGFPDCVPNPKVCPDGSTNCLPCNPTSRCLPPPPPPPCEPTNDECPGGVPGGLPGGVPVGVPGGGGDGGNASAPASGGPGAVNCPAVGSISCPPLQVATPSAALVIYDRPSHELMLGEPATGASFSVLVVNLPSNARHVELFGDGNRIGSEDLEVVVGPSTMNEAVRFNGVPLLASNDYRISVLDASNGNIASSGALPLWTDHRAYITTPGDSPGASSASNGTAPSSPDGNGTAAPSSPDGPGAGPSCSNPPQGITWATEGNWEGTKADVYGNDAFEADEAPMTTMGYVRPWTWGGVDSCGHKWESNPGTSYWWGVAHDLSGKALLTGTGSANYGFALHYSGGSQQWERLCNGLHCENVGYGIYASNGKSFMQTPPDTVKPNWEGSHNVNIPSATSNFVPSLLVSVAIDGLSAALGGWGGAMVGALGYAVPNSFETHNYDSITTGNGRIDGGGINANTLVSGKQFVSGEHEWRFGDYNRFTWTIQAGVDMEAHFHACNGCQWVNSSYTSWYNLQHDASVVKSHL